MTHTTHVQRTAVVTGAARGIGAAVASRLAGDGLAVGVADLDQADRADTVKANPSAGGAVLAFAIDAADAAAVAAALVRIAAAFGPRPVLVNNVGIGPHTASFLVSPGSALACGQGIHMAGGRWTEG